MANYRESIAAENEAFLTAFAKGDATAMAMTYTEDGQALPPNGEVVTGREALAGLWQAVFGMGIVGATLETVELEQLGNHAYEVGKYTLKATDGSEVDRGKYVVIWQCLPGGEWKWHRDIWNSSVPAG